MIKFKRLTIALAALLITSATAWAQTEQTVAVTPATGQTNQWTLTMPAGNVTLNVEYAPEFTATFKALTANTIQAGKATVTLTDNTQGTTPQSATPDADGKLTPVYEGQTITLTAAQGYKFRSVTAAKGAGIATIADATTEDIGKVVCAEGHLHDAKTAVPEGCTAVGILGKVTETGHGLILALKDATSQTWNTINGWPPTTSWAGTTLKVLPTSALGSNLTGYTKLGTIDVSNWAVAHAGDYAEIFNNLGTNTNEDGYTYDSNVNAYLTTNVGGTALSEMYWTISDLELDGCAFNETYLLNTPDNSDSNKVRPVLGF